MKKRILMLAHDPGGANAVGSVAIALKAEGYDVALYGHGPALQRFQVLEAPALPLLAPVPSPSLGSMRKLIHIEHPDLIITGTSGDDFSERYLWQAAEQCGVPAIAVLDQWSNFGLRFSPYGLAERDRYLENRQHPYKPAYITVMDEDARREIIEDGLEPDRVVVCGQPYFDVLAARCNEGMESEAAVTKERLGLDARAKVLLFISESIRQDYRVKPGEAPYWGYDEISIFMELVQALQGIAESGFPVQVLVKQHPLERDNVYDTLKPRLEAENPGLKILTIQDMDAHRLLMIADLVCGMSSMLLLESLIFDKPTISLQIGLNRENPLILEAKGFMKSILNPEVLHQVLKEVLMEEKRPPFAGRIELGATRRIIEFVEGLLCRN